MPGDDLVRQLIAGRSIWRLSGLSPGFLRSKVEHHCVITPKIIHNGEDAARESQDLRDKMKNLNFN